MLVTLWVHCLQFLIYKVFSGGNLRKPGGLFGNSSSEIPVNDLKQLETFFYKLSYFLHILDYTETVASLTDLGFLWFREFYLESSRVIQFPIECSLPWMLVDHVIEAHNTGLLESVLMPFNIYNDSARQELAVRKQCFFYDEIEAEVQNTVVAAVGVIQSTTPKSDMRDYISSSSSCSSSCSRSGVVQKRRVDRFLLCPSDQFSRVVIAEEALVYVCISPAMAMTAASKGADDDSISERECHKGVMIQTGIAKLPKKYLVNHGISGEMFRSMMDASKRFFELPFEEREKYMSLDTYSPIRELVATYSNENKKLFLMLMEAITEPWTNKHENQQEHHHHNRGMGAVCLIERERDLVQTVQERARRWWQSPEVVGHSSAVAVAICSNGRYKSVLHRAIVNSVKPRISVASLYIVPYSSVVRPSPKLIDESNPRRYMDTDFSSFLEYISSFEPKKKNSLESRKLILNE
ncbi:hypothetical protein RHMOL_Rhmol03G0095600 [Rhododendron molle]|uniref:Uncharacterized protein n=1 Tax=Rhododendron molle TaxID=49168 RepID=A0ACC0PDW8_RHOML|nr:hypothetical protein RHMOL_Rhmol03G0095600 [Rhododendron molle]